MAGAGDKKRVKENAAHLTKLQLLIGGANVSCFGRLEAVPAAGSN